MNDLTKEIIVAIEKLPIGDGTLDIEDSATRNYMAKLESALGLPLKNKKAPWVFYKLYSAPDVRASEIMSSYGLSRDEIIEAFNSIKNSEVLQRVLSLHPTKRNFFHKIKNLISDSSQIEKMISGEPAFPLAIEMHPSTECNSNCTFCYSKGHWYYDQMTQGIKPLSKDMWIRLVDECADNGTKKVMPIGGLEPLLALDKFLAILNRSHERGLDTLIFTNGIAFDPKNSDLVDAVLRKGSYFLSVRGATADTYIKITGTSPDDFDRSMSGMKFLSEEKKRRGSEVTLGFAFFITHENYKELPDVLDLARKIRINEVGLSCNNLTNLSGFNPEALQHLRELLRLYVPIQEGSHFDGLKITMNDTLLRLAYPDNQIPEIYNYELRKPLSCQNWYMKSAIDPFGNLYPCCLLAQPGIASSRNIMPFGQVSTDVTLTEIIQGLRDKVIDATTCTTCNPSEYNGLIAFEKLKNDYKAGIRLIEQPYYSLVH